MLSFPNCKINLGLYITGRRQDGYHNLETLFYPIALQDVLEVVPAIITSLNCTGRKVEGLQESNLVMKAYHLLAVSYPNKIPGLDIYLHKVIPTGAGLGGGSADGAFMLALLNDYCGLGLNKPELAAFALQLGSDCPFFIYNTPMFASGRGELFNPVNLDLSNYSIQLVLPGIHVATSVAFSMIQPKRAPYELKDLNNLPIMEWKDKVTNDFEVPVFQKYPVLAAIKQQLYQQGAIYASMSGSGSAIYGIFPKGVKAVINVDIPLEEFYVE